MRHWNRKGWSVFVGSLLAVVAVAAPARSGEAVSGLPPGRPSLVVLVSVDQMRADYLDRFRSLFTGGLRRLVEEGAVFTNARYRHACTETGPGHSVLLSGRSPRNSGIVGNSWYDRALRRRVNVVDDETVRVIGGTGHAASPAHFDGFTLGDRLKARSPRSRVVTISFKDRAAIMLGGKRADAAYWYEAAGGRFVTSSHYVNLPPRWLTAWNARHFADAFAATAWQRLLPDAESYRRLAGEDAAAGESDGVDVVFPHRLGGRPPASDFYDGLRRVPFADTILLNAALAAMSAHGLGLGGDTDLLGISFSACDVIGHIYGPDSQEMMDEIVRLDRTLGRFLDAVDRQVGKGRALLVLTADHGVMPLVETLKARGVPARRATGGELHAAVEKALAVRFPGAQGFFLDPDPLEYVLNSEAIARQGLERAEVERTIREALLGTGLVDAVYPAAALTGAAPAGDAFFPLHQRAFFAPRSGDLIARVKPYVYLGSTTGGTGHGTPHDYDRHVPIVFIGPGVAPGRHDVACGPEDIAWTLGRMLGIDYPQQDAETDLLPLVRGAQ